MTDLVTDALEAIAALLFIAAAGLGGDQVAGPAAGCAASAVTASAASWVLQGAPGLLRRREGRS